jgi:hypothetical protein
MSGNMFEGSELSHGNFEPEIISISENLHFLKFIHIHSYFFRFFETKTEFQKISENTDSSQGNTERSSFLPTFRVGTQEGSYSFLIPFDSIVPVVCKRKSSNAQKKIRLMGMSSELQLQLSLALLCRRKVHLKMSCLRTNHMLSGSEMHDASKQDHGHCCIADRGE